MNPKKSTIIILIILLTFIYAIVGYYMEKTHLLENHAYWAFYGGMYAIILYHLSFKIEQKREGKKK